MSSTEKTNTTSREAPVSKSTWGGAREGAGRPKTSVFVSHNRRPRLDSLQKPVRIVFRLRKDYAPLTHADMYSTFHRAALRARGTGLRIVHFSVEDYKIRLICEFKNQEELEKSLKSFATTLAIASKKKYCTDRNIKEAPKGPVFLGRFMMDIVHDHRVYQVFLKEMYSPSTLFKFSSALIFKKWTALFADENSETKQIVKMASFQMAKEKHLPFQRIATEVTATPQFSLSKRFL
jgi:hypothetical protein